MGYFDGIVDGSFKTTAEGVMLFYPNGILGKGYIIPNVEKKQEIRKGLKRFNFLSLAIIIISASSLFPAIKTLSIPWWVVGLVYLAIAVGLMLTGYLISRRFATKLMPVDEKLTIAESYQNSAKSHNIVVLLVGEIASLLFVVAGVWVITADHVAWYDRLNGILSILFFGFCSVAIGYMINAKSKR